MRLARSLAALALFFLPAALGCSRGQPREHRPTVIIPDMEFQPKYKAQSASPLFPDGRAMRTPPAGTVARGTLKEDPGYFQGKVGDVFLAHNPRPMTMELLKRGQNRFNIYCSPCHDRTGGGKGIVIGYGLVPPPSFHDDKVLAFADGYIMNVITNGVRTMPSYGAQIPPDDRWAIIAYLRTLERSQRASLADVPSDHRQDLK
jgi:mono/diheme cytochrome c family protein